MKSYSILIFTLTIVLHNAEPQNYLTLQEYNARHVKDGTRIIDGTPASYGQFPWQVAIYIFTGSNYFFCGGALISPTYILTAAHCAKDGLEFTVYLGSLSHGKLPDDGGQVTVVSTKAIVHKRFDPRRLNNDIALIELPEPVEFNDVIQPIALPSSEDEVGVNVTVTVSGWGVTTDDYGAVLSDTLNYVQLRTIERMECHWVYGPNVVIDSTLCAVGNPHHGTCNGDSGGALVVYDEEGVAIHSGITSFVHIDGCAAGYPSGYVRTSHLREWIRENAGV